MLRGRSNSAQRLSASSEFSPQQIQLGQQERDSCSTPFGIIGILTQQPRGRERARRLVLNAFRHHRNSHAGCAPLSGSVCGVLNAFRHHRNSHRRLAVEGFDLLLVLNAFRHHRNSHCVGSNHIVCRALQVCFRGSLRFALNIPFRNSACPCFRVTIAKESTT